MSDPVYSAKRRLSRADYHATYVSREIQQFLDRVPWEAFTEDVFHEGEEMRAFKARLTSKLPDDIEDAVMDAIEAFRSALDHACYASAQVLTGQEDPKFTRFPFADSEVELENTIKGWCKDLDPQIIDLLRGLKPYKGGNDFLWGFNKVRVKGQHKDLLTANLEGRGLSGRGDDSLLFTAGRLIITPRWDEESQELLIALAGPHSVFEFKPNILTDVRFRNALGLTGKEVVASLNELSHIVQGVVMGIEAETLLLRSER